MPPKNLICIVVDRMHAGMVGAYGNSWIHTPQLDRLASESFVFDQAVIAHPELEQLYRAYWQASHSPVAAQQGAAGASLIELVQAAGSHTALLTDEAEVASHALAKGFAEQHFIEPRDPQEMAEDVADTQIAQLFGAAVDWLPSAQQPFCLWLHARAMSGPWDAPYELRSQYADEEDPEPPQFVEVPDRWLANQFDPDELLGISQAYAGQMSLLDTCLGALLDYFDESGLKNHTLLALIGARGFPLGEHRRVGRCDQGLYNELIQVPCLLQFPERDRVLDRSQALVHGGDLPGTLLDWLEIDKSQLAAGRATSLLPIVDGHVETLRDHVCFASDNQRAIRTPAWHLRQPEAGAAELYAKPSDRWEVNEVANLLPEVVSGLQTYLAQGDSPAEQAALPALPELLVREVD